MSSIHSKKELLERLAQGAFAITPNNRLSSALLDDYFNTYKKNTLEKPRAIPYGVYVSYLFEYGQFNNVLCPAPIILNSLQCRQIWQKIIQSTPHITYNTGLLNAVMESWKHCELWNINPNHIDFSYTPQTQTFQRWWQSFNKQLNQLNAISEHQIIPYFITSKQPLPIHSSIWVCFDELTPQQKTIQAHFREQGIAQYHYDLPHALSPAKLCSAANKKEEYQQLIYWLEEKLAHNEQKIGVVIPELQQENRTIKRLLHQHFDSSAFNISLGEPLIDYPLVSHALNWLALDTQCTPDTAQLLLQSPYIAGAQEEFTLRARFLQENKTIYQNTTLARFATRAAASLPKLAALIKNITAFPKQASAHEWVDLFQHRLNELGFPGDLGLNSLQYQCYHRFAALFDEFRQLALINNVLSVDEALNALRQLAHDTIFQAQKNKAPIQISGLLEASGCEFDSLWVMGLTDRCLPAKPQLSPFIPPHIQRDLDMPHSNTTRELHFAYATLARLQKGSKNSVLSYPKLEGDNPNLPSALISHHIAYDSIPIEQNEQATVLVSINEEFIVPLINEELLTGGTALLSNQAKCPFKAFAEHRLQAKPLPQATEGIDAKERGTVLHRIMELLWQKLQSQTALFTLSEHELELMIEQTIINALNDATKTSSDEPATLIQDIELIRLKRLIVHTLRWEKQRPSFTINALEQAYTIDLAGLQIKVRVDRLDSVAENTWVIDYKSTLPASKPWNEERPQEPQLLLYALLDETINTIMLMQIKTGNILCSGLSENKSDIKGISSLKKDECWSDTRAYWRTQLTSLAHELQQGHCPPQPLNETICTYCDFKNLCRIV